MRKFMSEVRKASCAFPLRVNMGIVYAEVLTPTTYPTPLAVKGSLMGWEEGTEGSPLLSSWSISDEKPDFMYTVPGPEKIKVRRSKRRRGGRRGGGGEGVNELGRGGVALCDTRHHILYRRRTQKNKCEKKKQRKRAM